MEDPAQFSIVQKLVDLSRADWMYTDVYLREAEVAIRPLCTREQFRGMLGQRSRVTRLAADLRRAISGGDWPRAEQLASEGIETRDRIERNSRIRSLATDVYGSRSLTPSTTALALSGVVAQAARVLKPEISGLVRNLRALSERGDSLRDFYDHRAAAFERLVIDLPEAPAPRVEPSALRKAALAAADSADFAAVLRISRNLAQSGQDRLGRIRARHPVSGWVDGLREPIPEEAIKRAQQLGFEPAELDSNDELNAYLSCSCVDRAVLPAMPLTEENREIEICTCGHACPPQVGKDLKSSLDVLMVHPFLTSGGSRYLPWFGSEFLLVETFPEDEADARTPLLEALSLPRRRGLTRLAIEDALLSKGMEVCEQLGLDPVVYRIICIPFDVYSRLGDRYGWGAQQSWTHFDGYQVTRELGLQALVGGDFRFGGKDDLCGVGRGYDSERITSRFAVVRRDRFQARAPRDNA